MSAPRSDRLSVLHVLAPSAFGGLESIVRLLAAGQRRRGHDVLVAPLVTDVRARADWIASVRSAGVAVEPLIVRRRAYLAEWRGVRELVTSRRPSVVHTHGYHGDVVGGLAARRQGAATVATVHGFLGGDWKNQVYEWLQCRILRDFDAVIAVARPMAERLRSSGIPAERVHVVTNAFELDGQGPLARADARHALGLGTDGFRVGWIGRLSHEKAPDVMISALAATAADISLSVLGDGQERPRLETLARRLGVSDRITWHGTRPDAARLMPAFDIVALSSRTEGTPVVLFEAMVACTPVVATTVGGVPDVVSADEAILVLPEDPSALGRAIELVRRDPAGAAARAAAGRRRLARDFAMEPWVARVDAVYAVAMRRPHSTARQ